MLIAHVSFTVSEENRSEALKTLVNEVNTVRNMKGCIMFTPFTDSSNNQEVCVVHEWVDAASFEAYLSSESFKTIGQILRPMMTAPPVSKRFDAKLIEC